MAVGKKKRLEKDAPGFAPAKKHIIRALAMNPTATLRQRISEYAGDSSFADHLSPAGLPFLSSCSSWQWRGGLRLHKCMEYGVAPAP